MVVGAPALTLSNGVLHWYMCCHLTCLQHVCCSVSGALWVELVV